jgi:hypothetical protein
VQVGRKFQLKLMPELVLSKRVSGPVAAGVFRPRVVLPERIIDRVTPEQLRDILFHEVAHIVRHDQAVALLQNFAATIFWLHPLTKLLNRQLAQAREEVCDNYVLAVTDAPSYSRTLLTLAELVQAGRPLPGTVGLLTSQWKLERRVADLLDERRSRTIRLTTQAKTLVIAFSLLMATIAACGTLTLAAGHKNTNDEPASSTKPADKLTVNQDTKNSTTMPNKSVQVSDFEKRDSAISKSPAAVDESPRNDIAEDIQHQFDRLASSDFQVRRAATRRLIEIGSPAVAVLNNAKTTDREVAARIELILRTMRQNEAARKLAEIIERVTENEAARKLAEIIERVTENEKLYRNLETVIRRETQFDPKKWTIPTVVETLHTVLQGDLVYFRGEEV